ncbi:B12-binding domain-containing protein [Streptomyces sp. NPDC058200]|uniref:cobalamin B12-binding domain-containing protein n=1 Tax=Streptomyces sp. NPDC058200 TaxID=3346378 RepID=UPI0036E1FB59
MSEARTAITDDVRAVFDAHLGHADEEAAVALTLRLLREGVSPEEILLGLVAPAQVAVGVRWACDEWSVAQEHAATHISERAVAALAAATHLPAPAASSGAASAGDVVVTCSDGEWHILPARILSEVLRLRGYRVRFLGGHVPAARLVSDLHQHGPDVVALSCTLPVRLPLAYRLIQVCHRAGVPVLCGGSGFGPDGVWARALGADLYAADAAGADTLLRHRWPPPLTGEPSVDARSTEAYAELARRRSELLGHVVARLHDRFPAMRHPTDQQYEATTETLGHLLDSLAAGVFVDDPRVLTGYLSFCVDFLAARSVDPERLRMVLETLSELLPGRPLILSHLAVGQRWLDAPAEGTAN